MHIEIYLYYPHFLQMLKYNAEIRKLIVQGMAKSDLF